MAACPGLRSTSALMFQREAQRISVRSRPSVLEGSGFDLGTALQSEGAFPLAHSNNRTPIRKTPTYREFAYCF